MKYINIKRILLNIGFIPAIIAVVLLCCQLYENSFIGETTGTVTAIEKSTVGYRDSEDNISYPYSDFFITYTVNGGEHTALIADKDNAYQLGDSAEVLYDVRDGSMTCRTNNIFAIAAFGIPAALLIYFCRSAFKGYKTEYLDRYKKAVRFSIINGLIPTAYFIYYEFIFETDPNEWFSGLGEFFMCIILFAATIIVNIMVWIVSAAIYCNKRRKSELIGSVNINGSEQRSDL